LAGGGTAGIAGADPGFGFDTGVAATTPLAGFPAGAAGGFAGPPLGPGRAAVRSVNSTAALPPARTCTFFVTLSVSPSRSYSALNRYVNSCPAGRGGLTNRRSGPVIRRSVPSA